MKRRGFAVEYVRAEGTPGDDGRHPRINVIARRESGAPGPCVHFNGHIDVVQTGAGWTVDPFAGVIRDGKLFGRGTCDMKGGLAAAIVAVEALIDSGSASAGSARDLRHRRTRNRAATAACTTWPNAAGSRRRASITSSFPSR